MSTGELLTIDPPELQFPFELKKQISCTMQLTNKTENHVAFKVKTTNPKKYYVRPNTGFVKSHSTCNVMVTMQAQKEAPPDAQCRDKFLLQCVIASTNAAPKDITPEMFSKESGNVVEECKLRVTYVAPRRPPSPVIEESDEGSSPRPSVSGNRHYPDDARNLIARLTDEKNFAIQQSKKLQRELDILRNEANRRRGGISFAYVLMIGIASILLGYLMKKM